MMRILILAITISVLLAGCGLKNQATAIHLGASGTWNPFLPTTADGCLVGTQGSLKGITLTYINGDCEVTIDGGDR